MRSLSYGRQSITDEDIKAVTKVLNSEFLTQGPLIPAFESKLSAFTGARYTVAFNSGTAALHAAYFAIGLEKGDEIITSAMTFAATGNAALYLGASPVFIDVIPETGNIDIARVEAKITKKTKAIVPVHYAGQPVDLSAIKKIAKKHNLIVIDDACHALGAEYKNQMIGNGKLTDISVHSFHPVKHITTGEGGAIQTNNTLFYERALQFRTHGITKDPKKFTNTSDGDWYHEMQHLGFNYRLSDILAALGISQLKKLPRFLKRRREIATMYRKLWANNPYFSLTSEINKTVHAYHLFPILLSDELVPLKQKLFVELKKQHLHCQVHYIPVYKHPYYQAHGYAKTYCPNAEEFYTRELSVPIFPGMSDADVRHSATIILKTCQKLLQK